MSQTRRVFLKDAAIAGTAACTAALAPPSSSAGEDGAYHSSPRCPYFDQPLTCGGPDENGRYRCDAG